MQNRINALNKYHNKNIKIFFSTDLMSRGFDFDIDLVI
jgi:superfamily II DNA/RNA helicase